MLDRVRKPETKHVFGANYPFHGGLQVLQSYVDHDGKDKVMVMIDTTDGAQVFTADRETWGRIMAAIQNEFDRCPTNS